MVEQYIADFEAPIAQYAAEQISALERGGPNDTSTLRRTELLAMLAGQIVLLPELLKINSSAAADERKKLIADEGIYGLVGAVLEKSYEDFSLHDNKFPYATTNDIGLITELTALAVLNRPQIPSFVALQGLPAEDRTTKDDIVAYIGGKYFSTVHGYQVKTNEIKIPDHALQKGRYIGGIALGNSWLSTEWAGENRPLQTTHAILNDLNGTIKPSDELTLKNISLLARTTVKTGKSFIVSPANVAAIGRTKAIPTVNS